MKPVFSVLFTTAALGMAASSASAQEVCMPSAEMKAALIDWYGEHPVPGQDRGDAQLWASDKTGSWTLVKTLSDGNACVAAQGENWMAGLTTDQVVASLNQ